MLKGEVASGARGVYMCEWRCTLVRLYFLLRSILHSILYSILYPIRYSPLYSFLRTGESGLRRRHARTCSQPPEIIVVGSRGCAAGGCGAGGRGGERGAAAGGVRRRDARRPSHMDEEVAAPY